MVTGGGTGIGYAVAAAFAEAGDRVAITGRREQVLSEAAALLGAWPVESALGELPERVDVLVNNAGGNTDFLDADGDGLAGFAAAFERNLRSNVVSAALVTHALRERLADNARIVTIGSIAARTGAGSYGAAKAAVEGWNVSVAQEFGPRGITANVVAPGLIGNTMNKRPGTVEQCYCRPDVFGEPRRRARHRTGGARQRRGSPGEIGHTWRPVPDRQVGDDDRGPARCCRGNAIFGPRPTLVGGGRKLLVHTMFRDPPPRRKCPRHSTAVGFS